MANKLCTRKRVLLTTSISALLLCSQLAYAKDVTVCWVPPKQNTDGSTLTDLAKYRLEYGLNGTFTKMMTFNAGPSCVKVTGLSPGTWSFRMFAISATGVSSDASSTAMQVVVPPATQGSIEDAGRNRVIPPKK